VHLIWRIQQIRAKYALYCLVLCAITLTVKFISKHFQCHIYDERHCSHMESPRKPGITETAWDTSAAGLC
jgi:hypothetical protein